jgi:hypothetical protein
MELDFLIIGAEKAGTTFIDNLISNNPNIIIPNEEIKYFEDPDFKILPSNYIDLLFEKSNKGKIYGIKRPLYLGLPECPERIFNHSPNSRLIICLRNPIERAISAYYHYVRLNLLPLDSLNIGFKKILNGKYKETKYNKVANSIIDFGLYHSCISRYLKYFNKKQFFFILLEDIKKNPEIIEKKLIKFLGAEPIKLYNNRLYKYIQSKKSNQGVYSKKRLKFYRFYIKRAANFKFEKYDWKFRSKLYKKNGIIPKFFYYSFHIIDKTIFLSLFENKKPKLDYNIKNDLYQLYKKDINNLEGLLGKTLEEWHIL